MSQAELDEKLKLIEEALKNASGDKKKETQFLNIISDPQDQNICLGCE